MVCCERKVKKDGPNQNRLFYCCPKEVLAVSSNGSHKQDPRVINTGIVLFSNALQYQYMIEETGETFNSSKSNAKEACDEFRRFILKSVNRAVHSGGAAGAVAPPKKIKLAIFMLL
jgi:hypothetical protein